MQTINCCVFRLHIANSYARRECFIIRTGHQRQSLIQNSQRSIEGHAQEDRYQPAGADFPRKIITGKTGTTAAMQNMQRKSQTFIKFEKGNTKSEKEN